MFLLISTIWGRTLDILGRPHLQNIVCQRTCLPKHVCSPQPVFAILAERAVAGIQEAEIRNIHTELPLREIFFFLCLALVYLPAQITQISWNLRLDLFYRTVFINGIPKSLCWEQNAGHTVLSGGRVFLTIYTLWTVFDNFSFTVFTSAVIYYCGFCKSADTLRTCQHVPITCICDMSSTCVATCL